MHLNMQNFQLSLPPILMRFLTIIWLILTNQDEIYDQYACFPQYSTTVLITLSPFILWFHKMRFISFTLHNSSEQVWFSIVVLQEHPLKFVCLKLIIFKFLVTITCHLSSLDENVLPSFKTFHPSEKCLHWIKSKLPHLLQFWLYFIFLVRIYQKFLKQNGCRTLKMDSHVFDGFIFLLIQLLMNIQTVPHFKGLLATFPSLVLRCGYDISISTVFNFLYLFQNQLPDRHLLELPCFSNSQ